MSARNKKGQQPSESATNMSKRASIATACAYQRRQRSASPLNISRNEEKEELAELNDRLASYIDYVRKLETDKKHLMSKIKTYSEKYVSKHDDARNTYELEIASLRRLVDDLAKQRATAEVNAEKHKEDAKMAQSKLSEREADVRKFQQRIECMEHDLSTYKQNCELYEALKPDYEKLETKCAVLRRGLDAETVLRSELENRVSGLREEVKFKNCLLEEERKKMIERSITMENEIGDRKAEEYESKLLNQLQACRNQTAEDLMAYKTEMERTFENKLNELRAASNDSSKETDRLRDELFVVRKRSDDLEHRLAQKEAEVGLLRKRVDELERLGHHQRDAYEKRLALQREELVRLQQELEIRFAEFTDLMNTKVALDQEILMYRKMLEGEETRLNIGTSNVHETSAKRRRTDDVDYGDDQVVDEDEAIHPSIRSYLGISAPRLTYHIATNSNGSIEFATDQNELGKCVRIINSSNEETNIGNWVLKQKSDGHEVIFKFPRSLVLQPGASCQVWNSDAGASHEPPNDLVMRSQSFRTGSNTTFFLIGSDKEEQANCQITREWVRQSRSNVRSQLPEEKCFLM